MKDIDFSRIKALVVEDDRMSRDLVVSILESIGIHEIERAANGEEAFGHLSKFHPDVIVSDMMMEPVDGISFTRKIRTHRESPSPHTPVILLTAHTDRTTVIEARDAGVNAFVAKPVSIDEMRRKLVLVLNDPRQFVRSDDYVGPDRRRRELPLGNRPDRRKT
ncbi:chemotaxis protein CheYIII [alpha proteobacterium BAL199]|jgi:two-component system, chemotaxis family, chemotaxis protein CheY|nr:chemotaxis protein CheYIII [alpha proteobacterium BAL199]